MFNPERAHYAMYEALDNEKVIEGVNFRDYWRNTDEEWKQTISYFNEVTIGKVVVADEVVEQCRCYILRMYQIYNATNELYQEARHSEASGNRSLEAMSDIFSKRGIDKENIIDKFKKVLGWQAIARMDVEPKLDD